MGKAFAVTSTAVVTATLTSAFWIFAFNTGVLTTADARKVKAAGDVAVVDPATRPAGRDCGRRRGRSGRAGDPGAGRAGEAIDRYLHPGSRRRRARP